MFTVTTIFLFWTQCYNSTFKETLIFLKSELLSGCSPQLSKLLLKNYVLGMYTYGWFVLMFTETNSVKQLSFNWKIGKRTPLWGIFSGISTQEKFHLLHFEQLVLNNENQVIGMVEWTSVQQTSKDKEENCLVIMLTNRTRPSLVAQLVKNPLAVWETWVWSLGWENPNWRREWLPTPVFWLGEFHGLYSLWGHK